MKKTTVKVLSMSMAAALTISSMQGAGLLTPSVALAQDAVETHLEAVAKAQVITTEEGDTYKQQTELVATGEMEKVMVDGIETEMDAPGWWGAHTSGYEVTEDGLKLTFKATTYESASANWNTPSLVFFTGDEAKVNGEGYVEYGVQRADNFGWGTGFALTDSQFAEGFTWESWLAANKEGAECEVTANIVDGNLVTTYKNASVTATSTVPVDTTKPVYIALTGDACTATEIKYEIEQEVMEERPVITSYDDLDAPGWWGAHTAGVEVKADTITELTFKATTYESASANWNTPSLVFFTGDEAKVNGEGYVEYGVQRADNFGWGTGFALTDSQFAEGFTWESWLAANKEGADCKVTARIVDGNLVTTYKNASVTATSTVPVDTTKPVYIALTGDACTATGIQSTVYEKQEAEAGQATLKISLAKMENVRLGYVTVPAVKYVVENIGDGDAKDIKAALEVGENFEIMSEVPETLAAGESFELIVNAKTGLTLGSYKDAVVITAEGLTDKKVSLTLNVNGMLDASNASSIMDLTEGYETAATSTITVENKAEVASTLNVSLKDGSSFELVGTVPETLAVGEQATVTVAVKSGLASGAYSDTVIISDGTEVKEIGVSVNVNKAIVIDDEDTPQGGGSETGSGSESGSGSGSTEIKEVVTRGATSTIEGGFWTAWTPSYDLSRAKEFEIKVKGGAENWNNVVAVFTNKATTGTVAPNTEVEGYKEYAVVRADSWGWGGGDNTNVDGNPISYNSTCPSWEEFREIMKDATITAKIKKTSTGIQLVYNVSGANGKSFKYVAVTDCNTAEGLNVFFVCDGSTVSVTPITRTYVSADGTVVDGGQEEEEVVIDTIPQTTPSNTTNTNTTPVKTPEISTESLVKELVEEATVNDKFADGTNTWWTAFSDYYTIKSNQMLEFTLKTTSKGTENWNNWLIVCANAKAHSADENAAYKESIVLRADNFGWGTDAVSSTGAANSFDWSQTKIDWEDWDAWKAAMKSGAEVKITVLRVNNTFQMTAVTTANNGSEYTYKAVWTATDAAAEEMVLFFSSELAEVTLVDYAKYDVTGAKVEVVENTDTAADTTEDAEDEENAADDTDNKSDDAKDEDSKEVSVDEEDAPLVDSVADLKTSKKSDTSKIVGIVVASVAGITAIGGVVAALMYRKKNSKFAKSDDKETK